MIEIQTPSNKTLIIEVTEVFHKESKISDYVELARIEKPSLETGNISWDITSLKLGYSYVVGFKTLS